MAQASAVGSGAGSEGASLGVKIQRFGSYLSGMVMPNIGAFLAWGLITALFIPDGWLPNATLAALVAPMITYLLPLLMGTNKPRSCRRRFAQKVNVRRWLSMPG
jgi:mannitol-specific phosphotransferase system IIBC component